VKPSIRAEVPAWVVAGIMRVFVLSTLLHLAAFVRECGSDIWQPARACEMRA